MFKYKHLIKRWLKNQIIKHKDLKYQDVKYKILKSFILSPIISVISCFGFLISIFTAGYILISLSAVLVLPVLFGYAVGGNYIETAMKNDFCVPITKRVA